VAEIGRHAFEELDAERFVPGLSDSGYDVRRVGNQHLKTISVLMPSVSTMESPVTSPAPWTKTAKTGAAGPSAGRSSSLTAPVFGVTWERIVIPIQQAAGGGLTGENENRQVPVGEVTPAP